MKEKLITMDDKIKELFNSNISLQEIGKIIGVSSATISRRCKAMGFNRPRINTVISNETILETQDEPAHILAKRIGVSHQAIWERRKSLKVNKPLQERVGEIAKKNRKHSCDMSHFLNMDEIGSYWLGFIFADGCLRSHGKKGTVSTLSIGLKQTDHKHLETFCQDFGLPVSKVRFQKNGKKHYAARINIHDLDLGKVLSKLGLNRPLDYKQTIPDNAHADHFVRGFFDGDGSIGLNRGRVKRDGTRQKHYHTISFALENMKLAESLKNLIGDHFHFDIPGPYAHKKIFSFRCSHNRAINLARWIYKNPIRKLDRKYKIFLEHFA